ncbi:MAG: hypothetical protein AB1938_25960 [Myxococcota bacterium]
MNSSDWRREYRDATQAPPPGAKERVWRRLDTSARPSPVRRWAPALALAAAVVVAVVAWPRTESKTWRTDGSVVSVQDARFSYDAPSHTFTLEEGTLTASVWQGPALHVRAGGKHVEVQAAVVSISVAGEAVTVTPVEGFVLVEGQRVEAPAKPSSPPLDVTALEPKEAKAQRAAALAEDALQHGRYEDAARAFEVVAKSGTLGAEAALFRKGEVELRHLSPERALATFAEGDARFPSGSLGPERALSSLEALAGLQRWSDVEARAVRFLADFPASERADDVKALHATALFGLGRAAEACNEVGALGGRAPSVLQERCPH